MGKKPPYIEMEAINDQYWDLTKAISVIACLVISALAISIVSLVLVTRPDFEIQTNFEDSTDTSFKSTSMVPCSNKSLGDEDRTFSGSTHLGTACPQSDNNCSVSVCGTDGYCMETVIDGGECFSTTQCGSGFSCNSTCMCYEVAPVTAECTLASDCQEFNANPCIEVSCVDGVCMTNLTSGAECSSTTQCGSSSVCNATCMCEEIVLPDLTWQLYTPTTQAGSNIGVVYPPNYYDGVYYRIVNGYLEMQLYVEIFDSTSSSITKNLIINTPPSVILSTSFNGAGVFTASSQVTFSSNSTVWIGTGASYINSATAVTLFVVANDQPTGASDLITHFCAGTFIGPVI